MTGVTALLFPRCRICHGDISMRPSPSRDTCSICASAGDVERWIGESLDAQLQLDAARHEVASVTEAGSGRARRSAQAQLKKAGECLERATFRMISAHLTNGTRLADEATLADLEDARRGSAFGRANPEPRRRLAAYVASLLKAQALSEYDLDDIVRVSEPMTGSPLSDVRDVYVDVLIALANGDVLLPIEPPPPLVLPPGELLWMCAEAGLSEPTRVVETQAANRGVTAPLGLGARVGIEHAHTVTTERPGAFQETARGVLAITNRAAIFVGGRDVSIDHRNVVGLGADRNTCVVHDRHASTPVRFTANGGWAAVAAAFINAGIRQLD